MCTRHAAKVEIPNSIGYKLFEVIDGELYSPYTPLVISGKREPYSKTGITVCTSDEGFHVFTDLSLAKAALNYINNSYTEYVICKVEAMNIHTIGKWGDADVIKSFEDKCGIVMQCRKLAILKVVEKSSGFELDFS